MSYTCVVQPELLAELLLQKTNPDPQVMSIISRPERRPICVVLYEWNHQVMIYKCNQIESLLSCWSFLAIFEHLFSKV